MAKTQNNYAFIDLRKKLEYIGGRK